MENLFGKEVPQDDDTKVFPKLENVSVSDLEPKKGENTNKN